MKKVYINTTLYITNQPYEDPDPICFSDFDGCESEEDVQTRVWDLFGIDRESLEYYVDQNIHNMDEIVEAVSEYLKPKWNEADARLQETLKEKKKKQEERERKQLAKLKAKYEND